MTEEDAAGFVDEVGLATMISSTLHRIPRAIAAQYETQRAVIEATIREQDVIPDSAVTIQAGIDGVMGADLFGQTKPDRFRDVGCCRSFRIDRERVACAA
jgi:hypothetical protein